MEDYDYGQNRYDSRIHGKYAESRKYITEEMQIKEQRLAAKRKKKKMKKDKSDLLKDTLSQLGYREFRKECNKEHKKKSKKKNK